MTMNTRVESFPSNLLARLFAFGVQPYFQIDPAAIEAPPAEF